MQPYLSIVVASRNDNHGGDLLKRMQTFVTALLAQCRRHRIPSELVIVEWNPPPDRPPLAQALRWPPEPGSCDVRIIEVPQAIHSRYRHHDGLPLYQMIAKNAGIRRASGKFILATNIDLLFSDELMRFLAEQRLCAGKMYRIDRHDVMQDVPDMPVEAQLKWCESHLIRVHAARGTSSVTPHGKFQFEKEDIAEGGLALGEGWYGREFDGKTPFRWFDNDAQISISGPGVLSVDLEPGPGATSLEVFDHTGSKIWSTPFRSRRIANIPVQNPPVCLRLHVEGAVRRIEGEPRPLYGRVFRCAVSASRKLRPAGMWRALGRRLVRGPRYAETWPDFLHLTACGDFTLLARERWLDLRGYPEFDMFALHLDSLFCWAAHYGGAKELVLKDPMRAYHIEHEPGSGWTPEGEAKLFHRMAEKHVPSLAQKDMLRWAFDMSRVNAPMIFNRQDWGLEAEDLRVTCPLEQR